MSPSDTTSATNQGTNAVEARGLVKRFGPLLAIDGLDLTIPKGAFFAYLGPNGAGKSTSIALMTGLLRPDAGTLRVMGLDIDADPIAVKQRIGVVPEELALFERLTGRQQLIFCARMHGLSQDEANARADELLQLTELESSQSRLVAQYSKGMRRKLAIASALIHAPGLVFLDEPFEGIDVIAAGVIRELLRELSARGVTLLLTTHVLEIADRLATHAGIIVKGRLVDQGPVNELKARHGVDSLERVFHQAVQFPSLTSASLSFFPQARP